MPPKTNGATARRTTPPVGYLKIPNVAPANQDSAWTAVREAVKELGDRVDLLSGNFGQKATTTLEESDVLRLIRREAIPPTAPTGTPAPGTGSVTSVGLSLPASLLTVSGSPVTTVGTLTGTLATQSANLAFLGPSSGAAAAPTFRALLGADLPIATGLVIGAVKIGTGLAVDGAGLLSNSGLLTLGVTSPLSSTGGQSPTLSIPAASASANGHLTSADWTTFNGKVPASRAVNTTAPLTGGGTLASDLTLSIPAANATTNGYLTSIDWVRFDGFTQSGIDQSFKTIASGAGVDQFTAVGEDTLRLGSGTGVSVIFDPTTKRVGYINTAPASEWDHYCIVAQETAATVWTVNHGLDRIPTGILVVRASDGMVVEPAIEITDATAQEVYYTHLQATASTTWTIDHLLGDVPTGITVLADGIGYIDPRIEMDQTAPYQLRLKFDVAQSGKAVLSTGRSNYPVTLRFASATAGRVYLSTGSNQPPYRHHQTVASTTWTIVHGLRRVPTQIRAFRSTGEHLDPQIAVLEVDPFTLTLSFASAEAGTAWVS